MSPVHHELDRISVHDVEIGQFIIWDYRKWRVAATVGDESHRELNLLGSDGKTVCVAFGGRAKVSVTTPFKLVLLCADCPQSFSTMDDAYHHMTEADKKVHKSGTFLIASK